MTPKLWEAAIARWVGEAAREQLLLEAAVLSCGCLELLLPQRVT